MTIFEAGIALIILVVVLSIFTVANSLIHPLWVLGIVLIIVGIVLSLMQRG